MADAEALVARLLEEGEYHLASFTSEELVAVGADSPLQGLVLSERLASMGPIPLTAALSTALRGLVARGFVHPEGASSGPGLTPARADRQLERALDALASEPAGDDRDDRGTVSVPLSGDLAVVVALRRDPAIVALLSAPSPSDVALRGPLAHRRTDAILHGFTAPGEGLVGVLEERRSPLGIHSFVLRTLSQEAQSLCAELEALVHEPLESTSATVCEIVLEVAMPDEADGAPSRILVRVDDLDASKGRASISWPVTVGVSTTERLTMAWLPGRLCEILETLWRREGNGMTHVSAS